MFVRQSIGPASEAERERRSDRETRVLETESWPPFFAALAANGGGALGVVEVVGRRAGRDSSKTLRALREVRYSAAEHALAITLGPARGTGEVRYFFPGPRRIELVHLRSALEILIEEACGTRTLVRLFNLEAPEIAGEGI